MIYTSRYSNPQLVSESCLKVKISLGSPRWQVPYGFAGEVNALKPWGLLNIQDKEVYRREYIKQLEKTGVDGILRQMKPFISQGGDVVLLCFEDIRKGENDWCHRTMFADWWTKKTGEVIEEYPDPSIPKIEKPKKTKISTEKTFEIPVKPDFNQLSLF
jgi:hypothetical protein